MQSPSSASKRFIQAILERFPGNRQAESIPLLDQKELLELQALASEFCWSPSTHRDVAHKMSGDTRSIYLGSGMDYEESRPYQAGDDIRFMNWRLTARMGEPYMKVFREEKRPATFILVDRRSSMRFGSKKRLKVAQAARIAAYIAFSARQRHCGVAGVLLNNKADWFDAQNDYSGIFHFLNEAARPCSPFYEMHEEEPSLDYIIRLLQQMLVPGSDVCLVSDFNDLTENSRAALLQLSLECNLTAVHVLDKAEIELPSAGNLHIKNKVASGLGMVDTNDDSVISAYKNEVAAYRQSSEQLFKSLGINYLPVQADSEDISRVMVSGR